MASWLKVKAGRWPPRCSPKNGLLKSAPSTMKLLKMPRWPAMFSSSPSGPCEMEAPGVSSVRFTKLRPSLGSASTTSSSTRCALVTSVVSMGDGRLLTTLTVSASTTRSWTSRFTVSPTRRPAPSMRSLPRPAVAAATVRSYVPGGSSARTNVPAADVSTVVTRSVSRCWMTTTAPASGAPNWSLTVPRMMPVVVPAWAAAGGALRLCRAAARTMPASSRGSARARRRGEREGVRCVTTQDPSG